MTERRRAILQPAAVLASASGNLAGRMASFIHAQTIQPMGHLSPTLPIGRSKFITIARWALVPIAGWMGWAIAVWTGFELEGVLTSMCPDQLMVSGMCTAGWYPLALEAVTCAGAATAAALVVLLCTVAAPGRKRLVARISLIVGSIIAVALAMLSRQFYPFVSAIASGLLVWRLIDRRLSKSRITTPVP
jgi:hypothetical protein